MLNVVRLCHSDQKLAHLEPYDEKTQTWLTADLRSKFEMQTRLLGLAEGYEDLSIYRASELWRLLLRRLRPELKIVPREFLFAWLTHHLKKLAKAAPDSGLKPQSANSLLDMMDLLAPLFLHPQGATTLAQFFEAHVGAAGKWKVQADLAAAFFNVILRENWILPAWIPAILSHEKNLEAAWDRPLWVDLGADLRQSEVELLMRLSKQFDVIFFIPELKEKDQFHFLMQPSEELASQAQSTFRCDPRVIDDQSKCLRFSGPLAEVKQAVAQIRLWLEQGISPSKIALVAPEMEDYWPLLEPFLEREGISIYKNSVTRLQSWPSISAWLSRLRLRSGQVSYSDLEAGLNTDILKIRFEKFRALFRHSIETEDLKRTQELESFFALGGAPESDIDLEEFMAWSAHDWRDLENWEGFEILLKELLQAVPTYVRMDLDAWISFVESLAVKKEIILKPANFGGIALVNLSAVDGSRFERRIFLGLTESNFRKRSNVLVGAHELNRLGWDFGFFLDHPEQNLMNFQFHWALQTPSQEDYLFFPATGFTASPEAPHPLWLRKGGGEKVQIPMTTRWDEIQGSELALHPKILRDLGKAEPVLLHMPSGLRFSASALERYRSCSFQFAAEKIFHLLDVPARDLDLDARSKGSLAHKLFETLTLEPRRFDWTHEELGPLLDQIRKEVRLEGRDGLFWEIDKERHIKLAQRFLKFELEWSQQYPQARIEAREKRFEFYFDPQTETFSNQKTETTISIVGSIDRVETDSNGWKLVVDYKTNHDSRKNFANWIKENSIQMGFYSWVIDRGFVHGLEAGQVGGAVTYAYKAMEKRRGFVLPEIVGRLAAKVDPKETSLDHKEKFYLELEVLLKQILKDALAGQVQPLPFQENYVICESCQWSLVCRATHLNT